MAISTPLGEDVLLLQQFSGVERLSRLFRFELDLLGESSTEIDFAQLLGQRVTVTLELVGGSKRYFNGIISRLSQGGRVPSPFGEFDLTSYRAEMVPQLWLLSRRIQSRIFQQLGVPDILRKVFAGLDVAYQLQGTYHPRDYCVQYRETDLDFASRLMEEEGIYYFFKHTAEGHQMVVADSPQSHPDVPGTTTVLYEEQEGGVRAEDRVHSWRKSQEIRAGKVTLWDHTFELPGQNLEAIKVTQDSVTVGTVSHSLRVAGNDALEVYEYPGGYAQRFDGVAPGGGDRPAEIQKIFEDNARTAEIRMQQEAATAVSITGESRCGQFMAGHTFELDRHFNANGSYVLTEVRHSGSMGDTYLSGGMIPPSYSNAFECIPAGIPYRPARTTPRPTVEGTQTAVVVGNPGDEIFTDKYGRVKVQFPWDREGNRDANSSCWVRVATLWGGKQWGMIHLPRVGQEVVVAFEEGDPDRPIIIGSVYNAEQMPPFPLPAAKVISGNKSQTHQGTGYNEMIFDDTAGAELIRIHGQYDMDSTIEHDLREHVLNNRSRDVKVDETIDIGNDQSYTVGNNQTGFVGVDKKLTIGANHTESIGSNMSITIGSNLTETVGINYAETVGAAMELTIGAAMTHTVGAAYLLSVGAYYKQSIGGPMTQSVGGKKGVQVGGNLTEKVGGKQTTQIGGDLLEKVGGKYSEKVAAAYKLNAQTIVLEADNSITLKTGSASITMKSGGTIVIKGTKVTTEGTAKIEEKAPQINSEASAKNTVKGAMVNVEASAINTVKGALVKIN